MYPLFFLRLFSGLGFRTRGDQWYHSGREISSRALGKVEEAKNKFHQFVLRNKFPRTKKGVKTEILNFHLVQQGRKRFKQYVVRVTMITFRFVFKRTEAPFFFALKAHFLIEVCGKEARVHFRKLKPEEQKAITRYKNSSNLFFFA